MWSDGLSRTSNIVEFYRMTTYIHQDMKGTVYMYDGVYSTKTRVKSSHSHTIPLNLTIPSPSNTSQYLRRCRDIEYPTQFIVLRASALAEGLKKIEAV